MFDIIYNSKALLLKNSEQKYLLTMCWFLVSIRFSKVEYRILK